MYADAIKEQCEVMVGMPFCETYFGDEEEIGGDEPNEEDEELYDLSTNDAYGVKQQQAIVELED